MPRETNCPFCGAVKVAKIYYGIALETEQFQEELRSGKIVLGGTNRSADRPEWQCLTCGKTWKPEEMIPQDSTKAPDPKPERRNQTELLIALIQKIPNVDTLTQLLRPENLLKLLLLYGWTAHVVQQQVAEGKQPGEFLLELLQQEPDPDKLLARLTMPSSHQDRSAPTTLTSSQGSPSGTSSARDAWNEERVWIEVLDQLPDPHVRETLLEKANLLKLLLIYGADFDEIKQQARNGKTPARFLLDLLDREPNPNRLITQLDPASRPPRELSRKAQVWIELLDKVPDTDTCSTLLEAENLLKLLLIYGYPINEVRRQVAEGKIPGEFLLDLLDKEPDPAKLMAQLNPQTRQT